MKLQSLGSKRLGFLSRVRAVRGYPFLPRRLRSVFGLVQPFQFLVAAHTLEGVTLGDGIVIMVIPYCGIAGLGFRA